MANEQYSDPLRPFVEKLTAAMDNLSKNLNAVDQPFGGGSSEQLAGLNKDMELGKFFELAKKSWDETPSWLPLPLKLPYAGLISGPNVFSKEFVERQKEYQEEFDPLESGNIAKARLEESAGSKNFRAREEGGYEDPLGDWQTDLEGILSPLLTDLKDTLHGDLQGIISLLQTGNATPVPPETTVPIRYGEISAVEPYTQYAGWRQGELGYGFSQYLPGHPYGLQMGLRQPAKGFPGQGLGGGFTMGGYDFIKSAPYRQTNPIGDLLTAAPKAISTAMAHDFIQGIKTGKMDLGQTFINLGYSAAESMIQKLMENWLNQVVPMMANSFAGLFSGGSGGGGGGGGFSGFLGGIVKWIGGLFGGGSGESQVPGYGPMGYGSEAFGYEAYGGAFSHGVRLAFASGGIVRRPTIFPMARGWGLMGDAGPEAVMPLTRTTGGALGVKAVTAAPQVNVVINNNTQAQVNTEQQGNGDIIVSIDDAMAAAYQRRGKFYQTLGQSRGITR